MALELRDLEGTSRQLIKFETKMAKLARDGKINGPVHFSRGNETQLIKIFRGLERADLITNLQAEMGQVSRQQTIDLSLIIIPDYLNKDDPVFRGISTNDWLFTSYRCHYHALLKGAPPEWLREQIIKGRSMHPINRDYRFVSSAIVPGHLPMALGTALALERQGSPDHVWAFCGDMAAETGIFHETTKYAWRHDLPITFVVEDNGLSVDTPTEEVWGLKKHYNHSPSGRILRYAYNNAFPHQGVGREVGF